jgi:hypothetical protein
MLFKEFKNVFAWIYKDLKGILPKLAQHKIELDTWIPLVHEAKYKLNRNYAITIKQDINKWLTIEAKKEKLKSPYLDLGFCILLVYSKVTKTFYFSLTFSSCALLPVNLSHKIERREKTCAPRMNIGGQ